MLRTLKVSTMDLKVGMYVSELDRPWLETPFNMQGFRLDSPEEIDHLRSFCSFVFIDMYKSRNEVYPQLKSYPHYIQSHRGSLHGTYQISGTSTSTGYISPKRPSGTAIEEIFPGRGLKPYSDTSDWKEETAQAWLVLDALIDDVNEIFEHVRDGGTINVLRLKKAVESVIASMSRNPDACIWLARLKQHDQYTYQHALSASIWAVALGRQLGLSRQDLRSLSIGCILMDVGKLRIDSDLLRAPGPLSEEKAGKMREHVGHGIQIVQESGITNQDVLDIVAHHHERFDGSGYPEGLLGDNIPAFARIAGIVDTYDAVTSERAHSPAVSPSDAIRLLYNSRDREFQAELVEVFIQAVGIYPAGSIVELSTGEVGVVVSESRTQRLKPRVMLLLDERKSRLPEPRTIDLSELVDDQELAPTVIARSLEPGAYEIDLSQLEV